MVEEAYNWRRLLTKDIRGNVEKHVTNAALILGNHPDWVGKIAWNSFTQRLVLKDVPKLPQHLTPGKEFLKKNSLGEIFWDDNWTTIARGWLEGCSYKLALGQSCVREAAEVVAKKNSYHPVREWLQRTPWDGVPRLDRWLVDNGGVADSPYARVAFSKWLISGVARVFEPGCQADHVLVLEGDKGVGKTSFFKILGGEWYSTLHGDLGSDRSIQALWGKIIVELPELSAFKKTSDVERIKGFVTTSTDRIRAPYRRDASDYPRQCILGGSTNASEWLREDKERRFWPLHVGKIDLVKLEKEAPQMWSEAVFRYQAGEAWFIEDPSILAELEVEVEERRESDPWEMIIRQVVETTPRNYWTTSQVLTHLGIEVGRRTRSDEMRVGSILRHIGLQKKKLIIQGVRKSIYYNPKKNNLKDLPALPTSTKIEHLSNVISMERYKVDVLEEVGGAPVLPKE